MKKFYIGIKGIVNDSDRGVILLRRDYKSGDYWDTPGGRIEADESFEDTLRRELSEELPGIQVKAIKELLGSFRLHKDIDKDVSLVLLYFLVDAKLPEQVILSEEHSDYAWIKRKEDLPVGLNPKLQNILKSLL